MKIDYTKLPRSIVTVDTQAVIGVFDAARFAIGQGGVNSLPLPEKVIRGASKLKPRLMRVFLQEYFDIYPDHNVFNWTKLDAYLESFARTGTNVLATINFKPRALFPEHNQDICRPNNLEEFQNLIYQLVRRYSVERPIVTHWEHVNEADIGEWGGCPYRFGSLEESHAFYQMLIQPILAAFPEAKVGGPCHAMIEQVPGFVALCAQHGTQLDFVSYHGYTSDLEFYRRTANQFSAVLDTFPGKRPELMMDEWNQDFPPIFPTDINPADLPPFSAVAYDMLSVEEMAMQSKRAATAAKIMLTMLDTPLDVSFYFLLWDNCMFNADFSKFFSPEWAQTVMYQHWNEKPHRFGLFSESGKARPQYFVYQMLSRLGRERLAASGTRPGLTALAAREQSQVAAMIVNADGDDSLDQIVKLHFAHLTPGLRRIKVYRIDDDQHWSEEALELNVIEERMVDVLPDFEYQVFSPADSVVLVTLEEMQGVNHHASAQ
jgi:xylan 1,4-beta-xylosidase